MLYRGNSCFKVVISHVYFQSCLFLYVYFKTKDNNIHYRSMILHVLCGYVNSYSEGRAGVLEQAADMNI
jgi:hypothetical protein